MSVEAPHPGRLTRLSIDRILELEPGRRILAECLVPDTLWVFDTHFPRFPVVPGVFILGSAIDLAERLLDAGNEPGWRFAGAKRLKFRHYVRPGDHLELDVEVKDRSDEEAVVAGSARVGDRMVTSIGSLRFVRAVG